MQPGKAWPDCICKKCCVGKHQITATAGYAVLDLVAMLSSQVQMLTQSSPLAQRMAMVPKGHNCTT